MKRTAISLILFSVFTMALSALPANSSIKAGSTCNKAGQLKKSNGNSFVCAKSGKKFAWKRIANTKLNEQSQAAPKPIPSPSSSSSSAQNNQPNSSATSTPAPTPMFKKVEYRLPSAPSDNVEICKIKEQSNSRGMTGAGFPVWNSLTPSTGTMKWALIPIDFEDFRGESNFRPRVDDQMKLLSDWFATVSEGKFKVEWVVQEKWVTLPGKSSDYVIPLSVNLNNAANGPKLFKAAMDAADPLFDFTNVQTVNFILPKGQSFIGEGSQGFPWDQAVKEYTSNEGKIASYSIPGVYFENPERTYWSYWAHEFGHAIGLPHVGASRGPLPPFNPYDLMGGQDGPSRELSGWIRFYASWLSDEKVYCKEASKLDSLELTLAPLSSDEKGLKLAVIPVSGSKVVLVESRRVTKFSCGPKDKNGVLVYTYDARLGHGENFLNPVTPISRELVKVFTPGCQVEPFPDSILKEGDKVTVEGLTIEVLLSGNYDRIKITKT